MDKVKNLLNPLGSGGMNDTLKLVVIGGTMETARRATLSAWNGFVDSFFLTAHFSQQDYPYGWLMHWLSKQPAWGRSREFDITTRTVGRNTLSQTTTGDLDDEEGDEVVAHGQRRRKVAFEPSPETTHTIYYQGHWLRITRTKRKTEFGSNSELKVSVVARNNTILKQLVLEAKREYEKDAEHRVHIYMADTTWGCWTWAGARHKRPMTSIVLEPGVKDMLLADCKDFLHSEDWYADRGIPFRRGYLLHGVPGSGKTSLIHSIAGELGLDIYVVSLSAKGMSDEKLTKLMGRVPSRSILLLEDLDAAFTRGVSRDEKSTGAPGPASPPEDNTKKPASEGESTLSLSGLLNSLDGVAASEGRLLFATTNHIERLDPALSRPGRMDVWMNFKNATKWQAEEIFKNFFPSKSPEPSTPPTSQGEAVGQKGRPKRKVNAPILNEDELADFAKRFGDAIPEDELSVAAIQGYLLKNKSRPKEAVEEVAEWVIKEREMREKMKKEKEEREEKERKEREEREEKQRLEKEKKELEEKEKKEREEKVKERKEKKDREKKAAGEEELRKLTDPVAEADAMAGSASSLTTAASTITCVDSDTDETSTSKGKSDKNEKWVSVTSESTPTKTTSSDPAT